MICSSKTQEQLQAMREEVIYVKIGVANRFEDRIELHRDLAKYPLLQEWILDHERSHEKTGYTWNDLKIDMLMPPIDKLLDILKFMVIRPSTWIQFSPIYPSQGRWYWDRSKIIFWAIMVIIGVIVLT